MKEYELFEEIFKKLKKHFDSNALVKIETEVPVGKEQSRFRADLLITIKDRFVVIEFKNVNGLELMPTSYILNYIEHVHNLRKMSKKILRCYIISNAKFANKLDSVLKKEDVVFISTFGNDTDSIVREIAEYVEKYE